jgi:hypothetical protein
MKQEASGWPECCQNENDRWRYIRDYHEKEGILMMIFLRHYVDTVSVDDFHYMFYTE